MDINALKAAFKRHGLQERESQFMMIQSVYTALKTKKIHCIEAPTGTGKTLSYGIAAIKAKGSKQHIIISTATIALQEQLIQKDLPLLNKLLSDDITFTLAKGRRRYACHARLYDQAAQNDLLDQHPQSQELQQLLESKKWDGDRDTLKIRIPETLWKQVSTDASGCSGRRCAFYEDCVFYKVRRKIHAMDIIVVNHSLLLSDLELGGGAILPEIDKCLYIIDECHHLPHKALDHFAKSSSLMGAVDWINTLTKAVNKGAQLGLIDAELPDTLKPLTHQLVQQLKAMTDYLETQPDRFKAGYWIISEADLKIILESAQSLKKSAADIYSHCHTLQTQLDLKAQQQPKSEKNTETDLSKLLMQLSFITTRAQNLYETWQLLCHKRTANEAPIAKWFTQEAHFVAHASPINISHELKRYFWDKLKHSAILCSATIRALDSFSDFYRRTGLKDDSRVTATAITPFFDYSRSILFVPTMHAPPQGTHQQAHFDEVMALLPKLILPNSGTLVLFTSIRAMEDTFEAISETIQSDILMQNQHSKRHIIQKHKDRIRSGRRSILFGLASFGEGLDLPADFCQHVIIYKLPFAVPSTPIELTRNNWLKANNKNAFMLSTLPEASLRLTQYVGRLIRQENDTGIVTILDKRLYARPYGRTLLKNLPPFQALINTSLDVLKKTALYAALWDTTLADIIET